MGKIPKRGIATTGKVFTLNGFWYGRSNRYGKTRYYKSKNCRFDNTCGGTVEITFDEFHTAAERVKDLDFI